MNKSLILVTGGTGFIGSHTCVALSNAGYTSLIFDNLCNSDVRVLQRLKAITGEAPNFIQGDIRDVELLKQVLTTHPVKAVVHFAGLKAVGDSVADPLTYYDVNVAGTVALTQAMQAAGINRLIFSSSATVYGEPERSPIPESMPHAPANPYGRTKAMVEDILADLHLAQPDWRIARLRYFNPVGAHESGLIGEHPQGPPNNLMPFVSQVAVGLREKLVVHGSDYPTPDGTGVRDYVHVMDLAEGHVATLRYIERQAGMLTLNLGTGKGISVLNMVKAFEQASGQHIGLTMGLRRAGDVPAYWADVSLAHATLGWQAQRGLGQMCADSWRWQRANPNGYKD